jgi:outer membrane usher protein
VATCEEAARPAFLERLSRSHPGWLWVVVALSPVGSLAAEAAGPAPVEFNSAFLQGGSQVDVSRFSRGNPVLPGEYLVDLQINGKWVGRASVRFIAQPNSDVALPCIDRALIERIGLDFEKLSPSARAELQKVQSDGCVNLKAMIADAAVSFDLSQLRLDVSVPQAAMLRKPRGYVGPELWDRGVTSATLAYNLNGYRSATSEVASDATTTDGHADLTAGINFGSWHLRQRSAVEITSDGPASYQNIATYLVHDIPSMRSDLTVGDSFTDGAVFDSFGFRGVSLASDDQMLPDSQLQYAPVVRGIAHTNARVVVTQNGNTLLETTVSPGAFEISDLYATGYGGDLHVTIYEADGSQESFTVPYASLVQLLRPGVWRYTAVAGDVQPSLTGAERFIEATLQHGFNNYLTGYTGALGAEHYEAELLGIALNTAVGAVAADVTEARTDITDAFASSGQSLRLSYSKLVRDTHTNITLSTYRYSSSGYYSFSDALTAQQAALAGSSPELVDHPRSQWQININQTLPARWGNFYLIGSAVDYWHSAGTTTQFQSGYTNHFRLWGMGVSYSVSVAHQQNVLTGRPDNQVLASFSMPLGHSPHSPVLSTNFIQDTSGGISTRSAQEVVTGTAGENNQLSYSATASQTSGDDSYTANGQYRSTYTSVSASVSEGSGYSQQSLGATGGVVVHPGGVTLANQMGDTIGIVEAIGAEGARVTNSVGTVVDGSGYAVLPFLLPYRLNSINIDPDGAVSPDVEFKSTTESVAPRLDSVVMIRFHTVAGRATLVTALLTDGSVVPFGASVFDAQGSEVGLAGQDGRIYLRGIAQRGTLTARWGDAPDQQCAFKYQLPPAHKGDGPFVRIDATCRVDLASPNKHGEGDKAALDRAIAQP